MRFSILTRLSIVLLAVALLCTGGSTRGQTQPSVPHENDAFILLACGVERMSPFADAQGHTIQLLDRDSVSLGIPLIPAVSPLLLGCENGIERAGFIPAGRYTVSLAIYHKEGKTLLQSTGPREFAFDLAASQEYLINYRTFPEKAQGNLIPWEPYLENMSEYELWNRPAKMTGINQIVLTGFPKVPDFREDGHVPVADPAASARLYVCYLGGGWGWPYLYCDGVPIAHTAGPSWFSVRLTPGRHIVRTDFTKTPYELQVQAGQECYLGLKLARSGFTLQQIIEPLDPASAREKMRNTKPLWTGSINPKYR